MRRADANRRAWTARTSMGWQTMLADLSLILFMVTAAAMADAPKVAPAKAATRPPPRGLADPARAEPVAIWLAAPGGPALGSWLAAQQPDSRQQLTIVASYGPGGAAQAMARAQDASQAGGAMAAKARIIIEPDPAAAKGAAGAVRASLAYDMGPGAIR